MTTKAGAHIAHKVEIKSEPVNVETDCKETQQMDCDAEVKEEAVAAYTGCVVTHEAAEELYADHIVKQEMAVGPVVLQRCPPSDADASEECINILYNSEAVKNSTSAVTSQSKPNPLHEHSLAEDNPPQCEDSGGDFTTKCDLTQLKQITRKKLFCCKICNKRFAQKFNLTKHQQIHTGKKAFCCKICKKHFTWKHALIRHEQIHARERLLHCDICEKYFICNSDFTKHEIHCGVTKMAGRLCVRFY